MYRTANITKKRSGIRSEQRYNISSLHTKSASQHSGPIKANAHVRAGTERSKTKRYSTPMLYSASDGLVDTNPLHMLAQVALADQFVRSTDGPYYHSGPTLSDDQPTAGYNEGANEIARMCGVIS